MKNLKSQIYCAKEYLKHQKTQFLKKCWKGFFRKKAHLSHSVKKLKTRS